MTLLDDWLTLNDIRKVDRFLWYTFARFFCLTGIFYRENRTMAKCSAFNFDSEQFKQYYDFWEQVIRDLYLLGTGGAFHKRIGVVSYTNIV